MEDTKSILIQAVGWAWAEACMQLDNGEDPRTYDIAKLIERVQKDFSVDLQLK